MKVRTEKLGRLFRSGSVDVVRRVTDERGKAAEEMTISLSSEYPVERWFGMEVLSHDPAHVRLEWLNSGRAPLLKDHNRSNQIGAFKKDTARIGDDRKIRSESRFSRRAAAKEVVDDIDDGIVSNSSVGYQVHEYTRARDLETLDKDGQPEIEYWRATDWEPLEGSIVSLPADPTVGPERGDEEKQDVRFVDPEAAEDTPAAKPPEKREPPATVQVRSQGMTPEEIELQKKQAEEAARKAGESAGAEGERRRQNIIRQIQAQFGLKAEVVDKFITDGTPVETVREWVTTNWKPEMVRTVDPRLGIPANEVRKYSLTRAINALVNNDWSQAGFEQECSREQIKRAQAAGVPPPEKGGFAIPLDIPMPARSLRGPDGQVIRDDINQFVRANLTAGAAEGVELVGTTHMGAEFIDVLRNRTYVLRAGARVLSGLQGNIAIPRQTAAIAAGMAATENAAFTEGAPTYDQVTMSPKVVNAFQPVSQLLLQQGSPDVDALLRNDLAQAVSVKLDAQLLYGSGSSGEILGIAGISGVGSADFGEIAPTWAKVVEPETDISDANADVETMAWLVNSKTRGKFKTTVQVSGQAIYLWDLRDREFPLNGYRALVTNQCRSNLGTGTAFSEAYFGNWPELLVGFWGGVYVLVDPYTLATTNLVRLIIRQFADGDVRHPGSFCRALGIPN